MSAASRPEVREVGESTGTSVAKQGERSPSALAQVRANSVGELLQTAILQGTPIEHLDKLVDLYERVEAKEAAKEFALAMAAFQKECPTIKRSKTAHIETKSGSKYSYTYAPKDEIARTIAPFIAKNGLSYTFDGEVGQNTYKCVCTVRHIAGHSQSSSLTLPIENPNAPGLSPQQKVEAAESIAQRRTLASAFGLSTSDDDPSEHVNRAPISDDQAIAINDLIKEADIPIGRVLKFAKVERVSDIRAADYDTVILTLKEIIEKKKPEAK